MRRATAMSGGSVLLEDEIPARVIDRLIALGHLRTSPPGVLRSSIGGGQAIMIDPVNGPSWARPIHTRMAWLSVIDPQATIEWLCTLHIAAAKMRSRTQRCECS